MSYTCLSRLLPALALAATLAAAAACQKNGSLSPDGEDGQRVMIAPSVRATAPEDGGAIDGAQQDVTLYFMRADNLTSFPGIGYMATYDDQLREAFRPMGEGEMPLSFTEPGAQYYHMDGSNTLMRGWFPQGVFKGGQNPNVKWNFSGSQDIMVSNYLVGNRKDKGIDSPNCFEFRHVLTQLQFYIYAETASIASSWGKVTKITVKSQNSSCTFSPMFADMGTADELSVQCMVFGTPSVDFTAYNIPDGGVQIPVKSSSPGDDNLYGAAAAGAVMVQPKESFTIAVTVQLPDGTEYTTKDFTVPDADANPKPAFGAGEATKVILDFQPRDIDISLKPAAWTVVNENIDVELGVTE